MELIEPVAKDVRQARPHAVGAHPNGLSDHYNNQVPSQAPLFPRLAPCPISQATTSLRPACSAMSSGICPDQGAGQLRSAPAPAGTALPQAAHRDRRSKTARRAPRVGRRRDEHRQIIVIRPPPVDLGRVVHRNIDHRPIYRLDSDNGPSLEIRSCGVDLSWPASTLRGQFPMPRRAAFPAVRFRAPLHSFPDGVAEELHHPRQFDLNAQGIVQHFDPTCEPLPHCRRGKV
jgi:hypothetical protein